MALGRSAIVETLPDPGHPVVLPMALGRSTIVSTPAHAPVGHHARKKGERLLSVDICTQGGGLGRGALRGRRASQPRRSLGTAALAAALAAAGCGEPISNQVFLEEARFLGALPGVVRLGAPKEIFEAPAGNAPVLAAAKIRATAWDDWLGLVAAASVSPREAWSVRVPAGRIKRGEP